MVKFAKYQVALALVKIAVVMVSAMVQLMHVPVMKDGQVLGATFQIVQELPIATAEDSVTPR